MENYLKDKNEKCNNCRWCVGTTCKNGSSEFYNMNIEYEDCSMCNGYYPINDMELFNDVDNDTESLFD